MPKRAPLETTLSSRCLSATCGPSISTFSASRNPAAPPTWSIWPWVSQIFSTVTPVCLIAVWIFGTSPPGSITTAFLVASHHRIVQFCSNSVTGTMIAPAFALVSVCSVMSAQCRFFAGSQVKDSRTSWLKWGGSATPRSRDPSSASQICSTQWRVPLAEYLYRIGNRLTAQALTWRRTHGPCLENPALHGRDRVFRGRRTVFLCHATHQRLDWPNAPFRAGPALDRFLAALSVARAVCCPGDHPGAGQAPRRMAGGHGAFGGGCNHIHCW